VEKAKTAFDSSGVGQTVHFKRHAAKHAFRQPMHYAN
jgi:hypothetical protein